MTPPGGEVHFRVLLMMVVLLFVRWTHFNREFSRSAPTWQMLAPYPYPSELLFVRRQMLPCPVHVRAYIGVRRSQILSRVEVTETPWSTWRFEYRDQDDHLAKLVRQG